MQYREPEEKTIVQVSGLPLTTIGLITFIVFLVLKLTGTWTTISWFWVWFPLWIPWAVEIVFFIVYVIIYCIINSIR